VYFVVEIKSIYLPEAETKALANTTIAGAVINTAASRKPNKTKEEYPMAVFQQSDAAATGKKKLSPVIILVIAVVLLCCCCIAAIAILVLTGTITSAKIEDITTQNRYLPQYLALLQTWL